MRRGIRFIVLIREDLKVLTIWECSYKSSTFSSVILRPRVLVQPESNSRPPAWEPDAQATEPPVRGTVSKRVFLNSTLYGTDLKISKIGVSKWGNRKLGPACTMDFAYTYFCFQISKILSHCLLSIATNQKFLQTHNLIHQHFFCVYVYTSESLHYVTH